MHSENTVKNFQKFWSVSVNIMIWCTTIFTWTQEVTVRQISTTPNQETNKRSKETNFLKKKTKKHMSCMSG